MQTEITGPSVDAAAGPASSLWPRSLTCALLAFMAWTYFFAIKDLPYPHGDEIGLLNIPYRYAQYGDTLYPNHWSQSFGSDTVRRYPPIAASTLRNGYHAVVGFSPVSSRVFSALLMLAVVAGGIVLLLGVPELNAWQRWLILCQLGLTPVMIYTARSTRFEQEILFAGWIGAVAAPALIPWVASAWMRGLMWVGAGAALGLAGSSHPFGLVFGIVGLWLVVFFNYWHEQDGFRLWHRLGLLGLGLVLAGIPTFHWVFSDWETFLAFSQSHKVLYADRTRELIAWYAGMPPWNRLNGVLPEAVVAHLTVLHQASYEDFLNYPVPDYRFRVVVHAVFYVQLLLIGGYLAYSAWRRFGNGNPWVHLAVWLAAAFLAFGFWYTPIHTYKIYTSFFVNLSSALVGWRLADYARQSMWPRAVSLGLTCLVAAPAVLFLHYAGCHALHLIKCHRHDIHTHIALDTEFSALADMADRLDLRRDDRKVYTNVESWIAAGKHPLSLWESVREQYVSLARDADAVVFKNINVGLFLRKGPRDTAEQTSTRRRQLEQMRTLLAPMRLGGVVMNDFDPAGGYSFYVRSEDRSRPPIVARLQRDQQVAFYAASFEKEIPTVETPILLTPGRYLLLAWVDEVAHDDYLDVTHSTESGAVKKTSAFLTPIHTVAPASVFIEIEGARPVPVQLAFAQKKCSLTKAQLFRLSP